MLHLLLLNWLCIDLFNITLAIVILAMLRSINITLAIFKLSMLRSF